MLVGRHRASLLLLLSLGGACVGESEETLSDDAGANESLPHEQVVVSQQPLGDSNLQPKSGTPGQWVTYNPGGEFPTDVFWSRRDNPVLTASIVRRATQESQVNPAESAAATIRYRLSLSPFPFDQMEPYADANDASGTIYHSVFGIRLSATQMSTVTVMRDDWDLSAYSEGSTSFQLHPTVKLGRVRVVSFYKTLPTQTRIKKSSAEYVFDDLRVNDVSVHTTSTENPADVVVQDITSKGFHTQPDTIWGQCDIQWRMVSYYNCQLDAAVYENSNQGADGCPSQNQINARESQLQTAANACAGAPKAGDRTVIFFGSFHNTQLTCIEPQPKATAEGSYVHMTAGANGNTLSHELGHTLGLGHAPSTTQLMHVSSDTGTTITSAECTTARGAL